MAKADLTAERLRELLHYDANTGVFTWRINRKGGVKAGQTAGCLANNGYLVVRLDGKLYLAHRLAWLYVHGAWPQNKVDHKSRIKTDNRIDNLRNASDHLNSHNTTIRPLAGTYRMGLDRNLKKPWGAKIFAFGKAENLGYFATPEEAHKAYLLAKDRLHLA